MKKNVKILGAAAAALLAVAPVVASATTVNADFHIQPGTTTSTSNVVPLSLDISMNATGGSTTAGDAANSVKISSGIGTVNRTSDSKVSIIDASDNTELDKKAILQPGTPYRVKITDVSINGLTNNVNYDLGQATFQENSATPAASQTSSAPATTKTGSQLVGPGTLTSAPFYLVKTGDTTQPYFTDQLHKQLSNGAVANVGKDGAGFTLYGNHAAADLLGIAEAVAPAVNGTVITTESDVESQLAEQGLTKNADGTYNIPAGGFNITLTARNYDSDKTATVVVPFAGRVDKAGFPVITAKADYNSKDFSNSKTFSNVASQGGQNIAASKLIRNVEVGAEFGYSQALAPFTARTADSQTQLDMAVLSNPVNTKVPGRYIVTVSATDWSTGKTSRLSYTVQVGDPDATYQTVNYPAAYGINIWSIAGNTVSFTGQRQAGQSLVTTYDTRTVNGTSYTRINSADSNTWVPTSFLGNHSSKPSNNNNGEKAISGVARVTYNGKGAVKLLNANGRHVDQYVKKGSTWKVWAEKTVNGLHMYRIGNQNQWVPAMYVTLN